MRFDFLSLTTHKNEAQIDTLCIHHVAPSTDENLSITSCINRWYKGMRDSRFLHTSTNAVVFSPLRARERWFFAYILHHQFNILSILQLDCMADSVSFWVPFSTVFASCQWSTIYHTLVGN